jgi:hypothetical protein
VRQLWVGLLVIALTACSHTDLSSSASSTSGSSGTSTGTTSTNAATGTTGGNGSNGSNGGTIGTQGSIGGTGGSGNSSNTGGSSGGGVMTFQEFCLESSRIFCQHLQLCGAIDSSVTCSQYTTNYAVAECDVPDTGFNFNAALAPACLSAFNNYVNGLSCDDVIYPVPDAGAECDQLVQPLVPAGGACESSLSCIPPPDGGSNYCLTDDPSTCGGVCGAGAAIGQPCFDTLLCAEGYCQYTGALYPDGGFATQCTDYLATGDSCATGTCDPSKDFCNALSSSSPTCQPLLTQGQACVGGCAAGLFCDSPDAGLEGTCQVRAGLGEPCSAQNFAAPCQTGFACLNGQCVANPALLSQPCNDTTVFCQNSYCAATENGSRVCAPFKQVGESCDLSQLIECVPFSTCLNGTCQLLLTVGGLCANDAECREGLYCGRGGTCQTAGSPVGSPCDPAFPSSCSGTRCDPSTSRCAAFKSPGESCDPFGDDCGGSGPCSLALDGGQLCSDTYCVSGSGGNVCILPCAN